MSVYLYSVYCLDENKEISRWSSELQEVCPNNNTHTVRPNSISVIDTVKRNEVLVVPQLEENTGGRFRAESKTMTIPANSTTDLDLSWPIGIGVRTVSFTPKDENDGDSFNCLIFPDTVIGVLGATFEVGSSSLVLMSPQFGKMQKGFLLDIVNTTTGDIVKCGQITDTDPNTNTVMVEFPSSLEMPPGSLVRFSVNNMKDFMLSSGHNVWFKSLGSTNSFIPKNSIVRIRYTNTHPQEVKFNFHYEYFY